MEVIINMNETEISKIDKGDYFTGGGGEYILTLVRTGAGIYSLIVLSEDNNYYSASTSNKSIDDIRTTINKMIVEGELIRHAREDINITLTIDYK